MAFKRLARSKLFSNFFCYFLTVGTLTSVFKDNGSLRRHKTVEIMVIFIFLHVDPGSIKIITDPDPVPRGLEAVNNYIYI